MQTTQPQLLVIFGASGDLTKRKLIPALFELFRRQLLPAPFAVLGVSRTALSDAAFREKTAEFLPADEPSVRSFLDMLFYQALSTEAPDEYPVLRERIAQLAARHGTGDNIIFYLSTPPKLYAVIPAHLASAGLNRSNGGFRRLIIEKPFGTDLQSARQLNRTLLNWFDEDQLYRIDHYLGKETVQNVLVTRFANGIFEPVWNHNFIHHVEITSAESLGVEERGGYYDSAGAMRDMVQNHLMQLVGLVAMEPPVVIEADAIRNESLKVFQSLRPLQPTDVPVSVIRGQYMASRIKGQQVCGYRQEAGVNPASRTETFFAMKFFIDNWRWSGVPFYIRTGKKLPTRVTEVVIHFRRTPHLLFAHSSQYQQPDNQLIIRIQPDEGILLKLGMKVPGAGFNVQPVNLNFHYADMSHERLPAAYERLLLDCMQGDATLYLRGDAVEKAWEFVQPVLDAWQDNPDIPVYGYPAGTWGPEVADRLVTDGHWRYPCKNLSDDGNYCEL
ncbi:MAG: glucose-6-phosphate dehydrogenase [Bacteroidales bacterium]|nr:glucose-6-phosphate dehydrogenase [Bacteroidales bacterium]